MSSLQVANIHFESTANNRIQYNGSNGMVIVSAGANVATVNSTTISSNNISVANTISVGGNYVNPLGFGMKNRIINGDMRIDQRNAGAAVTLSSTSDVFAVDRFECEQGAITTNTGNVRRVADAPSEFTYSFKYTAGTIAFNSSTGWSGINQRIEGFNLSDLAWGTSSAKPVTLSFWVKSSIAGLYTINMTHYDGSNERWNNVTYNINNANTWEYKTLTFVGDTSYTIPNDNGATGWMRIYWMLGDNSGGASTTTSFNTWFAGAASKRAAFGQTNIISTSGATFQITGVQLEVGTVATPFERRPYGLELSLCQRYCLVYPATGSQQNQSAVAAATNELDVMYYFPVPMRTAPTLTHNISGSSAGTGPGAYQINFYSGGWRAINSTSNIYVINTATVNYAQVYTNALQVTAGVGGNIALGSSVALIFSSEL